jgi:hypothetical protein
VTSEGRKCKTSLKVQAGGWRRTDVQSQDQQDLHMGSEGGLESGEVNKVVSLDNDSNTAERECTILSWGPKRTTYCSEDNKRA